MQLGRDLDTFEPLAIKKIVLDMNGSILFDAEIRVLAKLAAKPHRNIPRLYGSSATKSKGFIVLEYFPFPSLKKMLDEKGPLAEEDALMILRQMVRGFFHSPSLLGYHVILFCYCHM